MSKGIGDLSAAERQKVTELLQLVQEMTALYDREYEYGDKPAFLVRHPFNSMTEAEQTDYWQARGMEINGENYLIGARVRYQELEHRIQQRKGGG